MKDFKDYVNDWFSDLVDDHAKDSEWCNDLAEAFGYEESEDESPLEFLQGIDDADDIYKTLFANSSHVLVDDLPDSRSFLSYMFSDTADDLGLGEYDFIDAFTEDMAEHCEGYDDPAGFFRDLSYGGCASGMIGMFIYNSDCKDFYIDHIDDMEKFRERWENETGEPVKNENGLYHYTLMCWFCYEEVAYEIGRALWPDQF